MSKSLTRAQLQALRWLNERHGHGCFTHRGNLLVAGEIAPVRRSTLNALRDAGMGEFYGYGSGAGRFRLTTRGKERANA